MQSILPLSTAFWRDKDSGRPWSVRLALAVAASLFVAMFAHLSVPLWFTPVPLSLSNFAVVLVGLALGPVTAFGAMALYLIEGASGMPVFSQYGPGGVAQLFGPTGGFLLAYPVVAAVAGWLAEKLRGWQSQFCAAALASGVATVLLFLVGGAWLARLGHLTPPALFAAAVAPFIPGEIVKIAAAAGIYATCRGADAHASRK